MNVKKPASRRSAGRPRSVWRMSESGGSRKRSTSSPRTRPSQAAIPRRKTSDGRHPVADLPADPAPERPARERLHRKRRGRAHRPSSATISSSSRDLVRRRRAPPARRSSRTSVTSSKKRGSSRVSTVRGCGRSTSTIPVIRPGRARHDDDARREEDRLGDRVRDEDDRGARSLPDPEQLHVQPLARHLVERAERLVHEQERRVERERARDRDALLHPARELPRVVVLEAAELDELDHLAHARLAPRAVPAAAARAAARCSSRPCASRRGRRPGRRSRSRGRAAPGARACR